jgi:tetratricopeptide (TPR) repeat protein
LLACAATVVLAFVDGGYFPSEWGLATLGFALVAAVTLLLTDSPRPPTLALAFLTGLTALALLALVSVLWSAGAGAPVLELERGVLYVAATGAALLVLARGDAVAPLLGGIVAGAVVAAAYGLATRLFPGHVGGAYDPSSGYQLSEPIGYWNALGLLCAIALLLAVGLAAHGGLVTKVLAAPALVVLLPALYFTFSRGALAALVAGAVVQVALDPRRARLIATALVIGAPAVAAVLYASRFHALTTPGDSLTTAQSEGRQVATALVVLAVVAAAAAVALHFAERSLSVPERAGRWLVVSTVALVAVAAVVGLVAAGGPLEAADRATASFREPLAGAEGSLDRRLLSVSGNGRADYWRVALNAAGDEPVHGIGAGGYEAEWLRERPVAFHARDAHSLYLETLAELGPVGLAVLLTTLALPLVALRRGRRAPLAVAAASAYAAFLLHAAVDWDWELPVVTVPALFCGAALLLVGDVEDEPWLTGLRRAGALVLVAAVVAIALVAHVGNGALAAAEGELDVGEPERALTEARRAATWAPWSEEPWILRAEAELDLGLHDAARRSLDRALDRNPQSSRIWYLLAEAGRTGALARARELDPLAEDFPFAE